MTKMVKSASVDNQREVESSQEDGGTGIKRSWLDIT